MTKAQRKEQPTLFDRRDREDVGEKVVLYALGDFQSRGFQLAERELALDRLRGAFKRATNLFEMNEFSDEEAVDILSKLGAKIEKMPSYVASHPFRITIGDVLANQALRIYKTERKDV